MLHNSKLRCFFKKCIHVTDLSANFRGAFMCVDTLSTMFSHS